MRVKITAEVTWAFFKIASNRSYFWSTVTG